eukprot:CAMPEP_0194503790 /NCGR_PEP_ID=MMETSP0253-20130528/28580_1 /TAXON_ID=2966 /ORGANISM="Noctiluca scintillans" /LENGTH=66 /DNA_ID=CAMNT_0039346111 /DNA_START=51 /DNA_END=251 /DNA_ORIENTATION=+
MNNMERQGDALIQANPMIGGLLKFLDKWGHSIFHYSMVPGVFAYGLWYAGEFTLNPVVLFQKVLMS